MFKVGLWLFLLSVLKTKPADCNDIDLQMLKSLPSPLNLLWTINDQNSTDLIKSYFDIENASDINSVLNIGRADSRYFYNGFIRHTKFRPESTRLAWWKARNQIAAIEKSAQKIRDGDIKSLIPIQQKFRENIAYQIGFVAHEIIHRYRLMVEIYQVANSSLDNGEFIGKDKYMPPLFMITMYDNMLTHGKHIGQLSAMLKRLPDKFDKETNKIVKDASWFLQWQKREEQRIKDLKGAKKREERKRKRHMKKMQKFDFGTTAKKKKRWDWPLNYGWSIELW